MSPARTVADDGAYAEAAAAIQNTLSACEQIRSQAIQSYETLTGSWQGGAGNAFRDALQVWNEKYGLLYRDMQAYAETMSGTRNAMGEQETAAIQGAQRFRSLING
ncbi:WXG100 family type VII secretion target [Streptomyces sp. ADI93-02]|uniref:WXG100 family type VII secretion target n=1 Tax=Streptomyces sp. ADI93-02 TaxID=1522757 RepID=UPI000F54CC9B|nr:WXG100 family type VII secretion target [Streptomyces sp. ADI93-02]RPK33351.1 WXG domain conatining protein [Streptomyces sp. ADI93-02]